MDECEALVFHPGNLEPQRPGTCDAAPRGCDAAEAAGRMRALRHQTSQGPTKLTKLTTEDPKVTMEWSCWIWLWINTYENTIFNGMNIHFNPAMTWCEQKGYYWFWHTAIYWERGIIPKNLIFTFCKMMQLGHITIIVNKYDDWLHPIFFRHISMIFLFFLVRSLVIGQHSPWILKADQ